MSGTKIVGLKTPGYSNHKFRYWPDGTIVDLRKGYKIGSARCLSDAIEVMKACVSGRVERVDVEDE